MKEQNIIRMKCITILLFIILSVVLIVVGFSQEYRSSSLFSGGVGLVASLCMLKTVWSARVSQKNREQLIISEIDERNLLIKKNSGAQAFHISLITTLAASILASLYHEEIICSYFQILLGIQLLAYFLIQIYYKKRL